MTDSALPASVAQPRALRFPGLVGIFLGISLCLHLAAIVYIAFSDSLEAATCLLIGQFLLGLSILRLVDGAFRFQDIRLFFLIFFFLYGGTLPIIATLHITGGAPGLPAAAFMYGTAMFG